MLAASIWIEGATRTGKTTRLIEYLQEWAGDRAAGKQRSQPPSLVLGLAANGDNRMALGDRLMEATRGKVSVQCTTPRGFFRQEVMLFFPLLVEQLSLKTPFPMQLNPENEQDLATRLWRSRLVQELGQRSDLWESRLVRRLLDLLQLAALAGVAIADLPRRLDLGLAKSPDAPEVQGELPLSPITVGELIGEWRTWCLERGLLTYGIIAELYGQHLLTHPTYQQHLRRRYPIVLADDGDEYPAIAAQLLDVLLDQGATGVFTFNPDGAVRLGLGADPGAMATLAQRCTHREFLARRPVHPLGNDLEATVLELVINPIFFAGLPEAVRSIQTISHAQLLQRVGEVIVQAVHQGQVSPGDVAVIAPGTDTIAHYTLGAVFNQHGIASTVLNEQRPLITSPIVRALLTLLALVYPGLGRWVNREAIAEMLVVLSYQPGQSGDSRAADPLLPSLIDPVRAGLIADHCFEPHLEQPRLLPVGTFPRWDRLGYQASTAYEAIVQWLDDQKQQQAKRLIPSPVSLLDRAIQRFLWGGAHLGSDQLVSLRELLETAQHYWQVDTRLRQSDQLDASMAATVGYFIQLLRAGTVTANPFPVRSLTPTQAVTLSNVFQYRSSRCCHRWQFWLDAGSPRWLSGVDALFGYQLFLQDWAGAPITPEMVMTANDERLRRILKDLLGRAGERLFLCHSDLATSGQEQTGPLLTLVNGAIPLASDQVPA